MKNSRTRPARESYWLYFGIVSHARATPCVLRYIAFDGHKARNPSILYTVANNPVCPSDVLTQLATLSPSVITTAVARHPATPMSALLMLAKSQHPGMQHELLDRTDLSREVLDALERNAAEESVRRELRRYRARLQNAEPDTKTL